MSYLVLFALLILPIGDAALSATFQYPVCANSQECLENPELMGGQHGQYFCASECFTDPDRVADDSCLYEAADPELCKPCMPKNDQQIYTCQPCCRCWSGQSINVDELAENKGCIDVCSGNIITPESWLDCEIMYGDGAANGRWGDRWWRVGGVAASVLIGGASALEGGM